MSNFMVSGCSSVSSGTVKIKIAGWQGMETGCLCKGKQSPKVMMAGPGGTALKYKLKMQRHQVTDHLRLRCSSQMAHISGDLLLQP